MCVEFKSSWYNVLEDNTDVVQCESTMNICGINGEVWIEE